MKQQKCLKRATVDDSARAPIYIGTGQCDQKKIDKCLQKLPKNDFTRKIIDFNNFTKIA